MSCSLIRNKKHNIVYLRILPCDCEVRGHCLCNALPIISVNTVVDKKRIIGKNWSAKEEERRKGLLTQKVFMLMCLRFGPFLVQLGVRPGFGLSSSKKMAA
jgi:hypothetical protein